MTNDGTGPGERRKNTRLYSRMITLDFDGEFYAIRDWSLGGFLIDGYEGSLSPNDEVPVKVILEDGSRTYEHAASASVVRADPANQRLAARFDRLDDDGFELLEDWQSGRLRRRRDETTH